MKNKSFIGLGLLAFLTLNGSLLTARAQGTAFTYQGRLNNGGSAANGSYDLSFTLFDAAANGNVIGALTNSATAVSNGLFTATLDFGGVFTGTNYWLEIAARTNGGVFSTLSPRQQVLPTPYALYAANAGSATTANSAGSVLAANIAGTVQLAQLPGAILTNGSSGVNLTGTFSGDGAGLAGLSGSSIADGQVVKSLNGLYDAVTLSAGTNITLTTNGNGLQISAGSPAGGFSWQEVSNSVQQAQADTGYLLENSALTTVTLPAAPTPGDIVRVSGAGAGGWEIAQNAGQSILMANLYLPPGEIWTACDSNRNWQCVASSANGNNLVAAVYGGQIYTSTDAGVIWTAHDSCRNWQSVASDASGSNLVAAVYGGQIYLSTDAGATWTAYEFNANWQSVASDSTGYHCVAAVSGGQIYTELVPGVWQAGGPAANWQSVASTSDGSELFAVVYGGATYSSVAQGTTWGTQTSYYMTAKNWQAIACSSDGTKLFAPINGDLIYTSTDLGMVWTGSGSVENWQAIACSSDGRKLVAAAYNSPLFTSTNSGGTWLAQGASRNWQAVASSADGTKLVAVVKGGQIYISDASATLPFVATTPGPAGYLLGAQSTALELQYIGNGQFLPLSHEGNIQGF